MREKNGKLYTCNVMYNHCNIPCCESVVVKAHPFPSCQLKQPTKNTPTCNFFIWGKWKFKCSVQTFSSTLHAIDVLHRWLLYKFPVPRLIPVLSSFFFLIISLNRPDCLPNPNHKMNTFLFTQWTPHIYNNFYRAIFPGKSIQGLMRFLWKKKKLYLIFMGKKIHIYFVGFFAGYVFPWLRN